MTAYIQALKRSRRRSRRRKKAEVVKCGESTAPLLRKPCDVTGRPQWGVDIDLRHAPSLLPHPAQLIKGILFASNSRDIREYYCLSCRNPNGSNSSLRATCSGTRSSPPFSIQLYLRRAQGEHNKGGKAYLIPDPRLTEYGIEECQTLEGRFPFQSSVGLIVSSPLRRTLQTAVCSFQPAITRGVRIVALPELQETSNVACDTGSDAADIRRRFYESRDAEGTANIDFDLVEDGWNSKVQTPICPYKNLSSNRSSRLVNGPRLPAP